LMLYAGRAREIPKQIFGLKRLEELLLSVGDADVADGISSLPKLQRFTLRVYPGKCLVRVPRDLQSAGVEYLSLIRVEGLERYLPG
ncbi:MAG: hypothetical protein R6V75_11995, partial [Bacteroidales bacterium]